MFYVFLCASSLTLPSTFVETYIETPKNVKYKRHFMHLKPIKKLSVYFAFSCTSSLAIIYDGMTRKRIKSKLS